MTVELWQAIAAVLMAMVTVGGAIAAMVRHMLRSDFVPRAQHTELEHRVVRVERAQTAAPTDQDMKELSARLSRVETGVAVAQTTIEGVNAGMKRVDHNVGLLLEHQLRNAT